MSQVKTQHDQTTTEDDRQPHCYMLCLTRPIGDLSKPRGHNRHYIGTSVRLYQRVSEQRGGGRAASRFMQFAVCRYKTTGKLVATWVGGYRKEQELKARKNAPAFCPRCNPGNAILEITGGTDMLCVRQGSDDHQTDRGLQPF